MSRATLFAVGSAAALGAVVLHQSAGLTQAPPVPPPPRTQAEMLRMSQAAEKPGLAEPFKGITAKGQVEPGLFGIRSSGVSTEPGSVFYYRIHSPVILIEFDHQTPASLRWLHADPKQPRLDHIHTVVRTPNGNDYGKDLLRQH